MHCDLQKATRKATILSFAYLKNQKGILWRTAKSMINTEIKNIILLVVLYPYFKSLSRRTPAHECAGVTSCMLSQRAAR